MTKDEALKLAKEFSIKEWNFDIVLYAGEEDGWHYFSCTREGRPKYSSMPVAIRVNASRIEEIKGDVIFRINANAIRLNRGI